jgi:putative glutamine amidotransferase
MQQRPVIGIATQSLHSIDGIPADLPSSWIMNQRYFLANTSVGAVPWMIPLLDDDLPTLRQIYERLDGIFLAGGVDMDPASYGAEPHERCGRTDPPRDTVELQLARWALEDGKPVLGVCRGMQVMNVAAGGTLIQDCEACFPGAVKHDYFPGQGWARDYLAHPVRMAAGSRLAASFGGDEARVNSMHHQAVDVLAPSLEATAWSPDGMVEALEGRGGSFFVGVQWHPEMLIDTHAGTRRLFESFIYAANEFHESRSLADSIA